MRYGLFAILMIAGLLGGCASRQAADAYVPPQARPHTALLFDAQPGYPGADQLAYRGDWPSVTVGSAGGEEIYYRETIFDYQGLWRGNPNPTYRQFRMTRWGSTTR